MTLTLKGDFAALKNLESKINDSDDLLRMASKAMAEETVDLIKEGFRTETDPYGDKWEPKQANDGRKTLSGKTSRLKNGFRTTKSSADRYEISQASVDYALPHQAPRKRPDGRLKRPKRMMVPEAAKGLPRDWSDALEGVAQDAVDAYYRGSDAVP